MIMNRNARQILAFGAKGQEQIEATSPTIVGLGGLGAQVTQGLAYLGVKRFSLIDHDVLGETNLNRTPGAFPEDVGMLKVEIAKRHILKINPNAEVKIIGKNLRSKEAIDAVIQGSHLFGCVDHDGPRLILMEAAAAYSIPYFDSASEIFPPEENQLFDFGGRVIVSNPGEFCLCCANQIDLELAKHQLEDAESKKVRVAHGYGIGKTGEAASVFSLNGVIANLAMTEFLVAVTGIRAPEKMLSYRGMRGIVTSSKDQRQLDCFTCGYLSGIKDAANIFRYIQEP
jgi:molybdopterin/thiamine biosynthesis adenylyltransferase